MEIDAEALGPDHPKVAVVLNNRAALLESQVRTMGNSEKCPE